MTDMDVPVNHKAQNTPVIENIIDVIMAVGSSNDSNNTEGYKIILSMTENSVGKFSFENLSLYNDPGWINNNNPPGKFSVHAHYYVYEYITGSDSQGTVYDGYHWVKKGRMFENNWIKKSVIQDKWMKILISSNNHGTVYNSDNTKCENIFNCSINFFPVSLFPSN